MIISTHGYRINHKGEKIFKPISELKNSKHKIIVSCDDCTEKYEVAWNNRVSRLKKGRLLDLCKCCVRKGERNPTYGKDRAELLNYARSFVKNFSRDFSEETKSQMSKSAAINHATGKVKSISKNRSGKYNYISTKTKNNEYADSALEMFRMIQLDNDGDIVTWTKIHGIVVAYNFNGKDRYTAPDFLIQKKDGSKTIEEVKGNIKEADKSKIVALEKYCIENNMTFVFKTQKELNTNGEYRKFLREIKNKNIKTL